MAEVEGIKVEAKEEIKDVKKGTKKVRIDYFQVRRTKVENGKPSYPIFNIKPILDEAKDFVTADRTYEFRGEKSRLQTIEKRKVEERDCWELQFLRMREFGSRPGIANEDGEFRLIELEDDEYIGEELAALYDEKLCVIAMQRNRNSLSPSGIEAYLNEIYPDNGIKLDPILNLDNETIFNKTDFYRSFTLTFADIKKSNVDEKSALYSLVREVETYEGVTATVTISFGNKAKKGDSLNGPEMVNTINKYAGDKNISKFTVSKKDSEDARVEIYDLVENTMFEFRSLAYNRNNPITHTRVFSEIESSYKSKYPILIKSIQTG